MRVLSLALVLAACAGQTTETPDEEWGMDGPILPTPPPGKEDSQNFKGLYVATDTSRTQVWSAKNKWEDRDTPAARKAGLAWGENSGLSWDEKFAKWLESLERAPSTEGYTTYKLTTPWGKTLPSPALECAETAMFLRITFAAWYELPFFMETLDTHGRRVYFGHNGVRTSTGRYASTPEFAIAYADKSSMAPADYMASWPHDAALRARKLGDDDDQSALAPGATMGTYLDELHLNKRAGHFTALALVYLNSANLADTANTFNIVPEAVRTGDILLHRWQKVGIGHTLVVKEVTPLAEASYDITLLSGSMPRRQGKWESGAASKQYFTSADAGGPGTNPDGDEYARLGGGLKRWRVTKNVGGYWQNTWMNGDEAHWINSTDYARIAARPARFETLLGEVSPEQTRTELLAQIADARSHLQSYPASCAARERRERAFEQLYEVSQRAWSQSKAKVDQANRDPMDYTLAELEYTRAKTCCWNSTTAAMYQIVKGYADKERADAAARGTCVQPTVFMSQEDGYERWRAFAAASGRAGDWLDWREDEPCPQRDAAPDEEREHAATGFCLLGGSFGTCTDAMEPNDSMGTAKAVGAGTVGSLTLCPGEVDWFKIVPGGTVTISFTHSAGDLDLLGYDANGQSIGRSDGTTNSETLQIPAGGYVMVMGYAGATNSYTLQVN